MYLNLFTLLFCHIPSLFVWSFILVTHPISKEYAVNYSITNTRGIFSYYIKRELGTRDLVELFTFSYTLRRAHKNIS